MPESYIITARGGLFLFLMAFMGTDFHHRQKFAAFNRMKSRLDDFNREKFQH